MKNIYLLLSLSIFIFISCESQSLMPIAEDVTGATDGGATISVKLMGSDANGNSFNINQDNVTYALESYASLGTGSVSGDVLTYTPNDNTNGIDNFSYRVYDSNNWPSNIANITIEITGNVNNPPTVDNLSATSDGEPITITLTGSDPEGDSITFSIVGQPSKGSVSLSGSTATYTPNPSASGSDSFTYKANDGEYDSNIGTVSITLPDAPDPVATTTIFFSEYAEGSSNNKYLEIYNPTGAEVDLTEYAFPNVSNAPTTPGQFEYWNSFPAGAKVAAGGVYVIAHPQADGSILAKADHEFRYLSNGDDGFKLVKGTEDSFTVIDVIGDWQGDPGSGWDVAGTNNATKDHTLVRKPSIKKGNSNWDNSRGTDATNSEWIVYDNNTWTYLGTHTID